MIGSDPVEKALKDSSWSWVEFKNFAERSIDFSSDSLHVIVGVLILLGVAGLLRKPVSSWWPWMVLFVLACINEVADLSVQRWPDPEMQYGESVRDLLLTMALPTVLLLAARYFPRLFASKAARQGALRPPYDGEVSAAEERSSATSTSLPL